MRRIHILFTLLLCCALTALADKSSDQLLKSLVTEFRSAKSIQMAVRITNLQGSTSGTIIIQGDKFYFNTTVLRSWFDGKTQWSYVPEMKEVNITTPEAQELNTSNPYSFVSNYSAVYNSTSLKSTDKNTSVVKLTPKKKNGDIREMVISINNLTRMISKIVIVDANGMSSTIVISDCKKGVSYPASTFTFSRNLVPKGTKIIDLR